MEQRIVWIHGIGDHQPDYSAAWERSFNAYLNLPQPSYVEILWETVFEASRARGVTRRRAGVDVTLTERERVAAAEVEEDLRQILQARASAFAEAEAQPRRGIRSSRANEVVEWSELRPAAGVRGMADWLRNPDEYLGDFARYLVSRRVRTAVKEEVKKKLRALTDADYRISIISHSWGTVVAYDTLLDLAVERPTFKVANLFTLGSPLWAVRRFLEDSSGRKPGQLGFWMNVDARGDLVGSWLRPIFEVDRDYQVPSFGSGDPHGSYFVERNAAVQRDLIASTILQ